MKKKPLTNLFLSSAAFTGTAVQEGMHTDPGSIYLANIKAGKYSIRPAGENRATVSVKIGGTDSAARSVETGLRPVLKANGNGNGNSGNNGPQSESDVDQVWVNIKEIEFLSESGGKTTVSTQQQSVDLIAAKTNASHLFHKAVIPEGKYKEIRLILDDNNGKIVKQGVEYSLKVPSGAQSGLKLKGDIDMVSGLLIEFALDFKYESLKYTPGQGYILSPVMNILSSKALLPFVHGMLIVKFKNQISLQSTQSGPTTGIGTVDGILSRYNAILMKQLIEGMPNMDMAVAGEVGLDRVYLVYFRQNQDVILAMMDLAANGNVELATPSHKLEPSASPKIPNDPLINGTTTYNLLSGGTKTTVEQNTFLTAINAYDGWSVNTGTNLATGFKAKIAIIDTGVDDTHPDLQGKVIQNRGFYLGTCDSFTNSFGITFTTFPYPCALNTPNSRPDTSRHGTLVAGIAAAKTDNGLGVAGINWDSQLLSIKIDYVDLNAGVAGQMDEIPAGYAMIEAVNKNANILNMSFGGAGYSYCNFFGCFHTAPIEFGAVKYAHKKRALLVACAGNANNNAPIDPNKPNDTRPRRISPYPGSTSFAGFFPASFPEVISVSALSENGTNRAAASNFGKVDISAPGERITTTDYSGNLGSNSYIVTGGTSLSAPMVAGFAGLILAMNPNLSPEEVKRLMCRNATQVTVSPYIGTEYNGSGLPNSEYVGCGMINLGGTLTAMQNEIPSPTITTNCVSGDGFPPNTCIAGRWFTGFSFQFNASNGVPPYTWSSVGVLPDKTTLNSSTGVLSGGPTGWFGPGWTFDVIVTDSRGMTDRKTFYFQSSL